MPLDRTDPCYRPVEIMLGPRGPYEDLRGELDRLVDLDDANARERGIGFCIDATPLSFTERLRLKVAMSFWNGDSKIALYDLGSFDPDNRARVVEALRAFLKVP